MLQAIAVREDHGSSLASVRTDGERETCEQQGESVHGVVHTTVLRESRFKTRFDVGPPTAQSSACTVSSARSDRLTCTWLFTSPASAWNSDNGSPYFSFR